jgi:hypothetical protein
MFETEDERKRAEIIIMILAKLYIVLEFSPDPCPVCRKTLGHDAECPSLSPGPYSTTNNNKPPGRQSAPWLSASAATSQLPILWPTSHSRHGRPEIRDQLPPHLLLLPAHPKIQESVK